jgi:DNA polymerase-3 subunit epsilon
MVQAAFLFVSPAGEVLPGGYETVINPGIKVPDKVVEFHGITTVRARSEGITAKTAVGEIVRLIRELRERREPLVISNVPFDWMVLKAEASRYKLKLPSKVLWLDPLCMCRFLNPYRKGGHRLANMAADYGVSVAGEHTARGDSITAVQVLRAVAQQYPEVRRPSLQRLQTLQRQWFNTWKVDRNKFLKSKGRTDTVQDSWPRQ